jgi:hypothetical protein
MKIEHDRTLRICNDMLGRNAAQTRGGDLDPGGYREHLGESVEPSSQLLLGTGQIERMGPQLSDNGL